MLKFCFFHTLRVNSSPEYWQKVHIEMENYLFSKTFFLKPYLKNITQNEGDAFWSLRLQWLLSSFTLVCISEVASPSSFIVSFLSKVKMNSTNWPAPNVEVLHGSVGRALHVFLNFDIAETMSSIRIPLEIPNYYYWGEGGCLICYCLKILKRAVIIISSFHFCISAAHITFILSIFIIIITFTITFIIIHTLPFPHLYQLLSLEPLQSHLHFFQNIKY